MSEKQEMSEMSKTWNEMQELQTIILLSQTNELKTSEIKRREELRTKFWGD